MKNPSRIRRTTDVRIGQHVWSLWPGEYRHELVAVPHLAHQRYLEGAARRFEFAEIPGRFLTIFDCEISAGWCELFTGPQGSIVT